MSDPVVTGPDLALGVSIADLKDGQPLLGHVGKDPALLVRLGEGYSAVGAVCASLT